MAAPPETAECPSGFRDRKIGLVVFGILTVLLGVLCAVVLGVLEFWEPLVKWLEVRVDVQVFLQMLAGLLHGPPKLKRFFPEPMSLGIIYAIALIWLGIGSVMARRWARALLLIVCWWWLINGLIVTGMQMYVFPGVIRTMNGILRHPRAIPEGLEMPAWVTLLNPSYLWWGMIASVVVFVVLPAVWILFYGSRQVKATCAARDPVARWTDRCPLPVLGVCVWLAYSAATGVLAAPTDRRPTPFFGVFVFGPLVPALDILIALIWGYAAWGLYRLKWRGWWIVTLTIAACAVSVFVTLQRHDTAEVLGFTALEKELEYPDPEMARIENEVAAKTGQPPADFHEILDDPRLHGHEMAWLPLCWAALPLGYLCYLRRYFPRSVVAAS